MTVLAGHLTRIISDIPVTFTWNGSDYTGTRATPDVSETLIVGGTDQKIEYQLFCAASVLTAFPVVGDLFLIEGTYMRVFDVRRSPDAGNLVTFLMEFARKA